MQQRYDRTWMEAQVAETIEVWNDSAASHAFRGRRYSLRGQQKREKAYDQELRAVEREARSTRRNQAERIRSQSRLLAAFGRFSAIALDLEGEATQLLTGGFLPVGTQLARWARQFDAGLSVADITQACRNAWTACGLQPLLGDPLAMTPSILGYSLLYPYSDNYLDREDVSTEAKLRFSQRFRARLRGERPAAHDDRVTALWSLVRLIEGQYPRALYPQVFDCLLAIHRAQEASIAQLSSGSDCGEAELLRLSCAKGGSSVLADACLAHGWLSEQESRFSFEWGVLLQLGDDLQDVREDMRRGSLTLFTRAAALNQPMDGLAMQLLNFGECVGNRMDQLPNGSAMLKGLLRMSWRSLILMAVAESHEFFSREFLDEAERYSPFRFGFLRARRQRLTGQQGLYVMLFEAFLQPGEGEDGPLPFTSQPKLLEDNRTAAYTPDDVP